MQNIVHKLIFHREGLKYEEEKDAEPKLATSEKITTGIKSGQSFDFTSGGIRRYFTPVQVGGNTWWVQDAVSVSELKADVYFMTAMLAVIQGVGLVLLIVFSIRMLKKSLQPPQQIADTATNIAEGNLDVDIVYEEQDEIGDMAAGMKQVVTKLQGIIANLDEKLKPLMILRSRRISYLSTQAKTMNQLVGAFKLKSDTE